MVRPRWLHLVMVTLLWSGVYVVTKGDSCDKQTPSTVVATPDADTPLDQLQGVVVIVSLVSEAGQPVVGAKTTLSWSSDNAKIAGTVSEGVSDGSGEVRFSGFGDADFGTWNLTVEGNYTQSISRPRQATNPNRITHVVKVLPSPSPSPSESPSPSPSPSASPSPTPTPTTSATATSPPVSSGGGGGGTVTATAVPGSANVNAQVVITEGSPQPGHPNAILP